jgi:hypothetical protein
MKRGNIGVTLGHDGMRRRLQPGLRMPVAPPPATGTNAPRTAYCVHRPSAPHGGDRDTADLCSEFTPASCMIR